ncbi:MAG TPA: ribonuclease III [Fredinandcohnia sp.]|nr:ribonuclease III [Fredinandcohnia sp.]
MKDRVSALGRRLGIRFRDPVLARQALTHKSWTNEHRDSGLGDNERLEFLGDAVLDLAISERLMARFPEAPEGVLSKLRAAMVDEESLSAVARRIGLGELLYLGRGEEASGGRDKPSLLADAFEAVIAAVYLHGGLKAVFRVVDRLFAEAFSEAEAGTVDRDFKTRLQEEVQRRHLPLPVYRVVEERGPDHAKTFVVEVQVGEAVFRSEGRSKKWAEQLGAKAALAAIESWAEAT